MLNKHKLEIFLENTSINYLSRLLYYIALATLQINTSIGSAESRDQVEVNLEHYNTFSERADTILEESELPQELNNFKEVTKLIRKKQDSKNAKICGVQFGLNACIVGIQSIAPFLAGFSYGPHGSKEVALASAIWNTLSSLGICAMDSDTKYGLSPLMIAASVCAWIYWYNWNAYGLQNEQLWIANTAITSISPVFTLLSMLCISCFVRFCGDR